MKILIINAGIKYALANGELNTSLANFASKHLSSAGCEILRTDLSAGYDIQEEISKLKQADIWLIFSPAWWMSTPWQFKKYFDEVFTQSAGELYAKALGLSKSYMLSISFELAESEFIQGGFVGTNVDTLELWLHKSFEFMGHKQLKTFMLNKVRTKPEYSVFCTKLKEHLNNTILEQSSN